MTVFISGVHGCGKTFLCQRYVEKRVDVVHKSASDLIRKAKKSTNWGKDKRVTNVNENQIALSQEVNKIISSGSKLLLDGHTVLIDINREFVDIDSSIFFGIDISAMVLIETSPEVIKERLANRDGTSSEVDIRYFMQREREQVERISKDLNIPCRLFIDVSVDEFSDFLDSFYLL